MQDMNRVLGYALLATVLILWLGGMLLFGKGPSPCVLDVTAC